MAERDQHQQRREDRARKLEDPVPEEVLERQPPVEEKPERNRRVEVAAGDLCERVQRCHQGEAEREGNDELDPAEPASRPEGPSAHNLERGHDPGRAAEDQDERAEQLS